MGKYEPLTTFLSYVDAEELRMTFAEIEQVIGGPLPASKQHAAWWSNNPANNVMTRAWLKAGFRTERVELAAERLVFRRERTGKAAGRVAEPPSRQSFTERMRDLLGGSVTVRPGVDLTAPTGEVWDAEGE